MKRRKPQGQKCFRTLTTINMLDQMFLGINFETLIQSIDETIPQTGFLLLITIRVNNHLLSDYVLGVFFIYFLIYLTQ